MLAARACCCLWGACGGQACTAAFCTAALSSSTSVWRLQVRRIGEYKSAGDQLSRSSMSEAQREQLSALLDDIYAHWVDTIAQWVAAAWGVLRPEGHCCRWWCPVM